MKSLSLLLVMSICFIGVSTAQETKEQKKKARYDEVVSIIESGKFEFIGRRANPQGGRQIDLTTNPNFLRVDGKKAIGDLPYFGRSFSAGYGSTTGIEFDSEVMEYTVEKKEAKFKVRIAFQVKGADDNYRVTLEISTKDNATLSVISNKKQAINYTGFIQLLKEN